MTILKSFTDVIEVEREEVFSISTREPSLMSNIVLTWAPRPRFRVCPISSVKSPVTWKWSKLPRVRFVTWQNAISPLVRPWQISSSIFNPTRLRFGASESPSEPMATTRASVPTTPSTTRLNETPGVSRKT